MSCSRSSTGATGSVGKNELLDLVWPDVVVEENNLQVHISALRKLLGQEAIVTIPGRGYRFALAGDGDGAPPRPPPRVQRRPAPTSPRRSRHSTAAMPSAPRSSSRCGGCHWSASSGRAASASRGLAQAVAHDLLPAFPDGVWLVEFAPLEDGAQLVPAVATVLHVRSAAGLDLEQLVDALRGRRMLLLLDNCEHVLDAAAELVAAVRRGAPDVQVLTTSQEPLRLADEQIVRLGTLAVPANLPLEQAQHVGALALFVARAQAADPRFRLAADNLAAALEICARLDGIALAIELAAARLPLLGLEGVRARLDDRFRVLTAGARFALPRHQTLRAALEWSHALLSADEQAVFRRLGVFVGSFDLDAAQRVGVGDARDRWAVLDILGALVDKSWVVVEDGAAPRYHLLETSRAFALECLDAAGDAPLAHAVMRPPCLPASMPAATAPGSRRRTHASPSTAPISTTSRRR